MSGIRSDRRTYRNHALSPISRDGAARWEIQRETAIAMLGTYRILGESFGQTYDVVGEVTHGAGRRQIRRVLGKERDLYTSQHSFDDAVEHVHTYVNMTRTSQRGFRGQHIVSILDRHYDLGIRQVEVSEMSDSGI